MVLYRSCTVDLQVVHLSQLTSTCPLTKPHLPYRNSIEIKRKAADIIHKFAIICPYMYFEFGVFAISLVGNRRRNIFIFHISFWCLTRDTKPTHYQQDYGDFEYYILLTYLIGQNNPNNGFQPAATHLFWRLCFLCAYANWSHQSMTGLPLFRPPNWYKGCPLRRLP